MLDDHAGALGGKLVGEIWTRVGRDRFGGVGGLRGLDGLGNEDADRARIHFMQDTYTCGLHQKRHNHDLVTHHPGQPPLDIY